MPGAGCYKVAYSGPVSGLAHLNPEDEEGGEGEGDGLKHLQKRWFDNMKEYLERKAVRIAAKQRAKELQERVDNDMTIGVAQMTDVNWKNYKSFRSVANSISLRCGYR